MYSTIARHIATVFHIGYAKHAPGTWGSVAGMVLAWPLLAYGGMLGLLAAAVVLFFFGWWAADIYEADTGRHDPSEIVVDEVVGQWLAMSLGALAATALRLWLSPVQDDSLAPLDAFFRAQEMMDEGMAQCLFDLFHGRMDYDTGMLAGYSLLCLAMFRLFDIWKPLHIGRVDRAVHGGLGTMLDDTLAGLVAAASVAVVMLGAYSMFFVKMTE